MHTRSLLLIMTVAWSALPARGLAQAEPDTTAAPSESGVLVAQADTGGAPSDVAPPSAGEPADLAVQGVPTEPDEGDASQSDSAFRSFLQENVAIHGFGNWYAGYTRVPSGAPNVYGSGTHRGDLSNVDFSLRQLVQPTPELRLSAGQSFSYSGAEGTKIELDLAGAQWTPNRWLSFRAGRILSPLGLYTEIYRVGTLRAFGSLPRSIYGAAGIMAQSYDGAELAFRLETPSGWAARISAFAGHSRIDQAGSIARVVEASFPAVAGGPLPIGSFSSRVIMDLMSGLHVQVETPVEGLVLAYGIMGSARRFTDLTSNPTVGRPYNNMMMIGSVAFLRDKLELRGEIAYRLNREPEANRSTLLSTYGLYLEGTYWITENLRAGVRFERFHEDFNSATLFPAAYKSILESNDFGAVINYALARDFVLKLEYHFIDGNGRAAPTDVDLYNMVLAGTPLSRHTHFVGFTSAMSF